MTGKVCKCGQGYVSAYDGKCGHCRTRKEQKAMEFQRRREYEARHKALNENWI